MVAHHTIYPAPGAASGQGLRASGATDPGRHRTLNEDRFVCDVSAGLFIAVDGLGGHAAGEVAAAIACEVIVERMGDKTTETAEARLQTAIAAANDAILQQARANPAQYGMGCVLTVVLLDGADAVVGHVGDTRLYEVWANGLRKVTHDHSVVGLYEDAGLLTEAEAMRHPRRSEILRDLGSCPYTPGSEGFVGLYRFPFPEDRALLLCSDGLTDLVPRQALHDTIFAEAGDPEACVAALIARANAAGGVDNITAVVVAGPAFARSIEEA